MWEIFIFVNPMGNRCLKTEKCIIDFAKQNNITAHFQFIALGNINVVNRFMRRNNMDPCDLKLRNKITKNIYDATLYCKAANFQGKRKGRQFIMTLQNSINIDHKEYSVKLLKEIAAKTKIDWNTLSTDMKDPFTTDQCKDDQRKANEIGINTTPATVIYDYDTPCSQNAMLIQSCTMQEFHAALDDLACKQMPSKLPDLRILK